MTQSIFQKPISPDSLSVFNQQVRYYKLAIELAEQVQPLLFDLLDKWNGKTYNKRFATALEKEFPYETGLSAHRTSADNFELTYYNSKERMIHSVEKDYLCNYIQNDKVWLLSMYSDLHGVITINAEQAKEQFTNRLNNLKDDYNKLSAYTEEKLNETKEEYLRIKKHLEDFVSVIPYDVRETLNIKRVY